MNEEMLLGAAVSHNEKSLLGSAKGMGQDFIASYLGLGWCVNAFRIRDRVT